MSSRVDDQQNNNEEIPVQLHNDKAEIRDDVPKEDDKKCNEVQTGHVPVLQQQQQQQQHKSGISAYDDRPIFNTLFHSGTDHDDSFHRERKVVEPLLGGGYQVGYDDDKFDEREQSTHRSILFENDDLSPRLNVSDDEDASAADISEEKPLLKKGSLAFGCNCKPKINKSNHSRKSSKKAVAKTKHIVLSKTKFRALFRKDECDELDEDGVIVQESDTISSVTIVRDGKSHERTLRMDEERKKRELVALDNLVRGIENTSLPMLTMPVDSTLSAIAEGDEDLTQPSSSMSEHNRDFENPPKVGKAAYRNLAKILNNTEKSVCSESEEEPNLFAYVDSRDPPGNYNGEKEQSLKSGRKTPAKSAADGEKKCESKFVLKCEEILLPSSNSDDDSAGGISDLTEEFLHIPVTSKIFKKAMEMYRESAMEENHPPEERDDYDDLEHVATVQI